MSTTQIVNTLVILALCITAGTYYFFQETNPNNMQSDTQTSANTETFTFQDTEYFAPEAVAESQGDDYTAESIEWIPTGETFDNWTTLITNHRLSPLSDGPTLDAEAYAGNIAAGNTSNGANILETSVLSNQEWEQVGVDMANPPYLLVYVYNVPQAPIVELSIQKIQQADDQIEVFIFAKRIPSEDLESYLGSDEYADLRIAVGSADFPTF